MSRDSPSGGGFIGVLFEYVSISKRPPLSFGGRDCIPFRLAPPLETEPRRSEPSPDALSSIKALSPTRYRLILLPRFIADQVVSAEIYGTFTVIRLTLSVMPPDGYTTVTISEETATKPSRVMAHHELGTMVIAIDHTAQLALDEEPMTTIELARLLYHRLQTEEDATNR